MRGLAFYSSLTPSRPIDVSSLSFNLLFQTYSYLDPVNIPRIFFEKHVGGLGLWDSASK